MFGQRLVNVRSISVNADARWSVAVFKRLKTFDFSRGAGYPNYRMNTKLSFPPFWLDVENAQLWQAERQIALKPKAFEVLRYLIERPGQLISKEELLERLWPDVYVTEGILKTYIREIRYALGERASDPQYIETVHRRGYRFIASLTDALPSQDQRSSPAPQPSMGTLDTPPIVGREAELAQLQRWWQQALAGERQLVFVTGEPGIGKTTLVEAFLTQVSTPAWNGHGQCVEQYGAGEAYLPILEALNRLCQRVGGEELLETLERYAPTWLVQMTALLDDGQFEKLKQKVSGSTHERMVREMAECFEAFTQTHPLIMWLEDLHWADHATIELLSYLARRPEPARFMLIGTYRPTDLRVNEHPLREVSQEIFAKGMGVECPLGFLTPEAVTEYVEERVGNGADAAALGQVIHQRTEGNALFMVHVVEHLRDRGTISPETGGTRLEAAMQEISTLLPGGLKQLIESQFIQLNADQQRLLEVASVAGTEFTSAALAEGLRLEQEAVETICEELIDRTVFLEETDFVEWPEGTLSGQYRFRHALYQNVLYDRIAAARRVRLHRAIGEREEAGYGERSGERAAELAVHFERGREYAKAIQYHQQAAERALGRSAYQETLGHVAQGLTFLSFLSDEQSRIHFELQLQLIRGTALIHTKGYTASEVEQAYTRARELCQQIDETPQLFPILWGLATFYFTRTQTRAAEELGEQLLALAEQTQDPHLLIEAYSHRGISLAVHHGEYEAGRTYLERGYALYDPHQHRDHVFLYGHDPATRITTTLSSVLWSAGYPDQALQTCKAAVAAGEASAHAYSLVLALAWTSATYSLCGDVSTVQKQATKALQISTAQDFPFFQAMASVLHGWASVQREPSQGGAEQLRQGINATVRSGQELLRPYFLALFAEAHSILGRPEEGLEALAEAITTVEAGGARFHASELYRLRGELTLQKFKTSPEQSRRSQGSTFKGQDEAEQCFEQALTIARGQKAKSLELRAAMSMSRLWQEQGQGKVSQARELLAPIYGWFTEGFGTRDLQEAKSLLEALD